MPLGVASERDYAKRSAASLRQIAAEVDRLAEMAREGPGVHPEMEDVAHHLARIAETLKKSVDSGSVQKAEIDSIARNFQGVARALRGEDEDTRSR